jgi:TPP-dependent pyruvate/acetoin dehydrogenase alpha subunit
MLLSGWGKYLAGIEGRLYRGLYLVRRVEEKIAEVYPTDAIQSPVHLAVGHEAVAVGVCAALRPKDVVFPYYRSHHWYLAKGGDLKGMVCELYGRANGVCGGRGGSMHLCDVSAGVLGTSAIVGTQVANATGYAYAQKLRGEGAVAVCALGDGACEEGVVWESLNFAALKGLPVLYVIEDNSLSVDSPTAERQGGSLRAKIWSFLGRCRHVDGGSAIEVYRAAADALHFARGGQPGALVCKVNRFCDHVGTGISRFAPDADPVRRAGETLDEEVRLGIESEVEREIAEAFAFAAASPFPRA